MMRVIYWFAVIANAVYAVYGVALFIMAPVIRVMPQSLGELFFYGMFALPFVSFVALLSRRRV
jgi:hypothetical protein